jgi:uncharacterized GH25 family protein
MRMKTKLIAAAALIAVAAPGLAHRGWLLPSATIFSGSDDWVTVDAAASNDLFFPDHRPMPLDGVKVWAPDGTESRIQNGATGRTRSTFDVQLDKPGTWKIGTQQSGVGGTFMVDGVEWRVGGRRGPPPGAAGAGPGGPQGQRPAGQPGQNMNQPGPNPQQLRFVNSVNDIPANATDIKITESSGRNEIFATAGEPTATVFQPTNKGLEMVPVTHPAELVKGETAKFKFLVDGKPAQNLKVTVIPGGKRYRDGDGSFEVTTGADGLANVDFPEAGMFWLNTGLNDDHPSVAKATARRMSYTATLEVMAP